MSLLWTRTSEVSEDAKWGCDSRVEVLGGGFAVEERSRKVT